MSYSDIVKKSLGKDIVTISKQKGESFRAQHQEVDGEDLVWVDCLGETPYIKYEVFDQIEKAFSHYGETIERGSAMDARLGEKKLPLDSIEGQIAVVYGYKIGDSVFRRVSPVCNILVWAGLCEHGNGILKKVN